MIALSLRRNDEKSTAEDAEDAEEEQITAIRARLLLRL